MSAKKVAVGVSGGVDSSVAVLLLKRAGYRVIAVFHHHWTSDTNSHVEAESRAEELCRRLDVPFYSIDITEEFRAEVIEDFVLRYREGLTPNPCVLCNEKIKFELFPARVRERLIAEGELDPEEPLNFSTGHYVRRVDQNGKTFLHKAADEKKDQSYMLYRLDPQILPSCIFPLGEYTKREVVKIAEAEGLPAAGIGESQDICFIEGDYADFIDNYLRRRAGGTHSESAEGTKNIGQELLKGIHSPGPIVDSDGRKLGSHRGYMHYTIGQRQGLGLSNGPWYVSSIDARTNTIRVARRDELGRKDFRIASAKFHRLPETGADREAITAEEEKDFEAEVMVRYNATPIRCSVRLESSASVESGEKDAYGSGDLRARVFLEESAVITPGQSAVFYKGDILLGGGIILPEKG